MAAVADQVLAGKTAVVVGASSGIGKATALLFARHGATVFAAGRSQSRLQLLAETNFIGAGQIHARQIDACDEFAMQSFLEEVVDHSGALHIMINGAGVEYVGNIADGDPDQWREMLEVNVISPLIGAKLAIQTMRKGGWAGHVVHFGSIAGRSENTGVYGATKAAIDSITISLRAELEDDQIRIVNIIPGAVMTNFVRTFPEALMNPFLQAIGLPADFRLGEILSDETLQEIQSRAKSIVLDADAIANAVLYAVTQPPDVHVYEIFVRPPKNIS